MAQLVEHLVHIEGVIGSSPIATTTNKGLSIKRDFFIIHIEGGERSPPSAVVILQLHRWNVPFSSSYSSLSVSVTVVVSVGREPLPLVQKLEQSAG